MSTTSSGGPGRPATYSLIAAPVVILIGEVVHPTRSATPVRQLAIVAAHPHTWYAAHLLLFIGVAMTVPAVIALGALLRPYRPSPAAVGVWLAGVAAVCFAGLLTVGFVVGAMAAPTANRAEMTALFERLFHSPGFVLPFEAVPFMFAIGLSILAEGLRRARIISGLAAFLLGGGATGLCLIGIVPSSIFAITAAGIFAAGMAPIGIRLLRSGQGSTVPARALVVP
jgi:hypothetical protein